MNEHIMFYVFAAMAGLMAGMGDACLKNWMKEERSILWLFAGIVLWNISLAAFIPMFKRGTLAQCVVLYILANCVAALMISQLVFHEELSKNQWYGIVLAIVAVVIMEVG